MKIFDFVKIPAGSFDHGRELGFVRRSLRRHFPADWTNRRAYIAKGSRVEGAREKGLDDITKEGGALIKDLRGTVAKIDTAVSRLNEQALSKENMDHLKETFDNLSKATAALSESSKKIDGVIEKADGTMGSAKEAADKVQLAVGDAQKTIQIGRPGPERSHERATDWSRCCLRTKKWRTICALSSAICAGTAFFFIGTAPPRSRRRRKTRPPPRRRTPIVRPT